MYPIDIDKLNAKLAQHPVENLNLSVFAMARDHSVTDHEYYSLVADHDQAEYYSILFYCFESGENVFLEIDGIGKESIVHIVGYIQKHIYQDLDIEFIYL